MKKKYNIIHSLDKGLYLLEIIEQAGCPVTLQNLWQKLRWDKSTIYRQLTTLERRGYLYRNPQSREYSLGIKIYALYDSLIRRLDLQQITKPYLTKLVKETGQTSHLAVAVGKCIVFIDRAVGSEILSVNTQIGANEPLHCTALGKAFLAYVDEAEMDHLLEKPLTQFTSKTIVGRRKIEEELRKIRRRGYAIDNEEYIEGIRCIASPVLNQYGAPVAQIGISGPKNRISGKNIKEYGELIKGISHEISAKFGYGIGSAEG